MFWTERHLITKVNEVWVKLSRHCFIGCVKAINSEEKTQRQATSFQKMYNWFLKYLATHVCTLIEPRSSRNLSLPGRRSGLCVSNSPELKRRSICSHGDGIIFRLCPPNRLFFVGPSLLVIISPSSYAEALVCVFYFQSLFSLFLTNSIDPGETSTYIEVI